MQRVVIVSGYFNPIHKGHIEYFENAKSQGDKLWVIVNSDLQRELKGSEEFQDEAERLKIVKSLRVVDKAILSIDEDRTVIKSIAKLVTKSISHHRKFMFANGGDQTNETIPESEICKLLGVEMIDGLGNKIQSSSWLLNKKK
jgi:D-beta-D-heptose 7-phosphate kinase/D-beta-D-heptose 1-phosphate adenosyltransferase